MSTALREAIFGSGHVSVCVERDADADAVARQVAELLEQP